MVPEAEIQTHNRLLKIDVRDRVTEVEACFGRSFVNFEQPVLNLNFLFLKSSLEVKIVMEKVFLVPFSFEMFDTRVLSVIFIVYVRLLRF